jgi:hypothetical protein
MIKRHYQWHVIWWERVKQKSQPSTRLNISYLNNSLIRNITYIRKGIITNDVTNPGSSWSLKKKETNWHLSNLI